MSARRRSAALLVPSSLLLAACASSPEALSDKVHDLPGVTSVHVEAFDGDDDIPFARVPKDVTVRMDDDASAGEIMAVFDALDDDVDDGDVGAVTVKLAGRPATLATGEGIHADDEMVDQLVAAHQDPRVKRFRRNAYPVLPSVDITLAGADFDLVASTVAELKVVPGVEAVTVRSGRFVVSRDGANDNVVAVDARSRFVQRVLARFRLTGALVAGRVPLILCVRPADQEALQAFVLANAAESQAQGLGRIVVGQGPPRRLLESTS